MAAHKGRDVLLKISDGTSPGTFTTVGGIRSRTITVNNETVDITTSDEAPWRALLGDAGLRSVSLSGSGVYVDDAAIQSVEDLAYNGATQEFQVAFADTNDTLQGVFQVTSFERGAEHVDAGSFSITLESAAAITLIRG